MTVRPANEGSSAAVQSGMAATLIRNCAATGGPTGDPRRPMRERYGRSDTRGYRAWTPNSRAKSWDAILQPSIGDRRMYIGVIVNPKARKNLASPATASRTASHRRPLGRGARDQLDRGVRAAHPGALAAGHPPGGRRRRRRAALADQRDRALHPRSATLARVRPDQRRQRQRRRRKAGCAGGPKRSSVRWRFRRRDGSTSAGGEPGHACCSMARPPTARRFTGSALGWRPEASATVSTTAITTTTIMVARPSPE